MTRRHHIEPVDVFFDVELGGPNPRRAPLMWIGASARYRDGRERDYFEEKVCFSETDCTASSLKKPGYSQAIWQKHAVEPITALKRFNYWLREHATVEKTSKNTGATYHHAQLFAFNASFESDFLFSWQRALEKKHPGEELYLPAERNIICVYQRALNMFHQYPELSRPANFKLGTLCEHAEIPFSVNESHTPLYDAQKAAELYYLMQRYEYEDDEQEALEAA